jgi:hypothetical protein
VPIKQLTVSFKISAEMFARMLAAGHEEMSINVFSDSVTHTPEPKKLTDRIGIKELILQSLRDDKKLSVSDIRMIIVGGGYSAKSLNGQIHQMKVDRLIKRAGHNLYAITKKGLDHVRS